MPVALILIAIGLIAAGVRGTYKQLGSLIVGDFTGQGNFLNWLAAIGIAGCIGYVPALQKFSRAFIALVIIAMFLKQGTGIYSQFTSALQGASPGTPTASDAPPSSGAASPSQTATGPLSAVTGTINGLSGAASSIEGAFSSLGSIGSFFGF